MLITSNITSPTAAGRRTLRYRFVFADSHRRDVAEKRRRVVAEHVAGWMGGLIVREQRYGTECIVVVELARPALVANAERVARECPHYVPDTFSTIGQAGKGSAGNRSNKNQTSPSPFTGIATRSS